MKTYLTIFFYPLKEKFLVSKRFRIYFDNPRTEEEIQLCEYCIRQEIREDPYHNFPEETLKEVALEFLLSHPDSTGYFRSLYELYSKINGFEIMARMTVLQRFEDLQKVEPALREEKEEMSIVEKENLYQKELLEKLASKESGEWSEEEIGDAFRMYTGKSNLLLTEVLERSDKPDEEDIQLDQSPNYDKVYILFNQLISPYIYGYFEYGSQSIRIIDPSMSTIGILEFIITNRSYEFAKKNLTRNPLPIEENTASTPKERFSVIDETKHFDFDILNFDLSGGKISFHDDLTRFQEISQIIDKYHEPGYEEKILELIDLLEVINISRDDRIRFLVMVSLVESLVAHNPYQNNYLDTSVSKQFRDKVADLLKRHDSRLSLKQQSDELQLIYKIRSEIAHGHLKPVEKYFETKFTGQYPNIQIVSSLYDTRFYPFLRNLVNLIIRDFLADPRRISLIQAR
jgi:hypothetical protein